jgi:restriction system protein
MPIPQMNVFLLPCLKLLAGSARNTRTCLPDLKAQFRLTEAEMSETIESGNRTRVFDRADWAVHHLLKAGLLDRPERGIYVTSDAGMALLATKPSELTMADLRQIPVYRAYLASQKSRSGPVATGDTDTGSRTDPPFPLLGDDRTPAEWLEKSHREIEASLASDLLSAVQGMSPTRFEQLIVDLLLAMGYGGGDRAMGDRIGKSGDGGIDGVINEDKLGLDAVYVQAKRYAPDAKVGRPALQAFVGSLTGEGANKGVFVTTSDFSREARDYLNRVQHRIVLINGELLSRLMIQHEVGVRARKTYVVRSVDEDYFFDEKV